MQVERFSFRELDGMAPVNKKPGAPSFVAAKKLKSETPAAPPPPPTFTEEQLKAAERDGYKKGFLEGTAEGKKQAESEQAAIDQALSRTVEQFVQALSPLFAEYRNMLLGIKERMPQAALAIARKVAGQALDERAEAIITEVAVRACDSMAGEPKISITVHDSLATTLTYRLEQLAPRMPAATEIEVLHDAAIPPADCRIEWNQGSMERDTARLWQQIEQAVEVLSTVAKREAEEQLELLQMQVQGKG